MICSEVDFVYNTREGPQLMLLLPWYQLSQYRWPLCRRRMRCRHWALFLDFCATAGTTRSQFLSVSHVLKLRSESTSFVLFLIGYSVPLAFPYERGTISLFLWKSLVGACGDPVESVGVFPACGPEWARLFGSVLFCNEKHAQFSGYSSYASSVQRVPEYLTFLTAVLVLFLFQMLIAGTHKYSGRTRSVSCSVGELTCYLLGYFSGFVGCFHMWALV